MHSWQAVATGAAITIALGSLALLLLRRSRHDAEVIFAVVSASLALSLMSPWMAGAPTWMLWAVAIGGSATCNGYWLLSRALFRGEGGVNRIHVMVAAGVALLIAGHRGTAWSGHGAVSPWASGIGGLLTLTSSTLLVLTFLEALRKWSPQWPVSERRMRMAFMMLFASCILATTLLEALTQVWPSLQQVRIGVIAICASAMILFTHGALWHRRRVPSPPQVAPKISPRITGEITAEEDRLVRALRHHLDVLQVFREPDLKVTDLARRLGTAEYKLSRVCTQVLGEKNFNQMINRRRIEYACRRLAEPEMTASILDISMDAGFASLGPFNRAFKAMTGCTPTTYRTVCRATGGDASPLVTTSSIG